MSYISKYFKFENNKSIIGLTNELNSFCIKEIFNKETNNVLVVTNSLFEANMVFNSLKNLNENTYLFPMDDFLTSVAIAVSPDLKNKRLETLDNIRNGKQCIVVTNLMGYLKFLPDYKETNNLNLLISKDSEYKRSYIIDVLDRYGYKKESLVTSTGEYAVRGYIIDIFPIESEHPIRIEFFDEDIDSLRMFDESSQKSIDSIDKFILKPYCEIHTSNNSSLLDYLDNPIVFNINNDQIEVAYEKLQEEIFNYNISKDIDPNFKHMFNIEELSPSKIMYLSNLSNNSFNSIEYKSVPLENFNSDMDLLKDYVNKNFKDHTILFYLSRKNQINAIRDLFDNINICDEESIRDNVINIINKKISKGFVFDKYIVISENDISKIKDTSINYKNNLKIGKKLKDFEQIKPGDYVVHTLHGIGVYNGIISLTKNGIMKDYLQINYLGNDKIYIPVEKISTIYKYSDADGIKPKINKLNSVSWAKTQRELSKKIKDISGELIKLYAARANIKVDAYNDIPEEEIFKDGFIHNETIDQQKAIIDTGSKYLVLKKNYRQNDETEFEKEKFIYDENVKIILGLDFGNIVNVKYGNNVFHGRGLNYNNCFLKISDSGRRICYKYCIFGYPFMKEKAIQFNFENNEFCIR